MIYDTDVTSFWVGYTVGGAGSNPVQNPFRLKGIILYPGFNVFGGIALHDGTSSSDPLMFKAGVQDYTALYFDAPMIKIPGNGIKFNSRMRVEWPTDFTAGTNSMTGATFFIQNGG